MINPSSGRGRPVPPGGGKSYASYTAVVSPDGRFIAECDQGRFLGLQDLATGKEIRRFKDLPDGVSAAAFTPDSRMLAWGGWRDPTIHLIELATGQERGTLVGHKGRIDVLAFAANGRILVSGSEDTTAVVWDLTGKSAKNRPLTEADLDACWTDLISSDAARAFRAMQKLMSSPREVVVLLSKHLEPIQAPDAKRQAKIIADLDSDTFATRDAAMKDLSKIVETAEPALRNALEASPSPEARRRIEQLLARLEGYGTSGEPLRQGRAIEVLECAATPEARRLLQKLAGGAAGAWLTREAKSALERLAKPTSMP